MVPLAFLFLFIAAIWSVTLLAWNNKPIYAKASGGGSLRFIFYFFPALYIGFCLVALRPFTAGGDTEVYLAAYGRISSPLSATSDAHYGSELLFWPTQALLKHFFDPRSWFVVNYLIVVGLSFWAYRKITDNTQITPQIFCLLFIGFFAVYTGNTMRQIYSIPLACIAFQYALSKSPAKFILVSILAIGFHWSALLLFLSPLFLAIPNKLRYYLAIPLCCALFSFLSGPLVEIITAKSGIGWLAEKNDLYMRGMRESHIDAVWKTANFWLCMIVYAYLVFLQTFEKLEFQGAMRFLLMATSIMLFFVTATDVSERYMTWSIFMLPFSFTLIITSTRLNYRSKNIIFCYVFLTLALLTFTRESARITLGLP